MYTIKLADVGIGQLFRNHGNLFVRLAAGRVHDVSAGSVVTVENEQVLVQVGRVTAQHDPVKESIIDLSRTENIRALAQEIQRVTKNKYWKRRRKHGKSDKRVVR